MEMYLLNQNITYLNYFWNISGNTYCTLHVYTLDIGKTQMPQNLSLAKKSS